MKVCCNLKPTIISRTWRTIYTSNKIKNGGDVPVQTTKLQRNRTVEIHLHSFLTMPLGRGEWWGSCPRRLNPRERNSSTNITIYSITYKLLVVITFTCSGSCLKYIIKVSSTHSIASFQKFPFSGALFLEDTFSVCFCKNVELLLQHAAYDAFTGRWKSLQWTVTRVFNEVWH